MIRNLVAAIGFASLTAACAVSTPLPEYTTDGSVIDYANDLMRTTTGANLDRVVNRLTGRRGEEAGYRWLEDNWCPMHTAIYGGADIAREFSQFCAARGGVYDQGFCRDRNNPFDVLFFANVISDDMCTPAIPHVELEIYEPIAGYQNASYLAVLQERGYLTESEDAERRQDEAIESMARRVIEDARRDERQARHQEVFESSVGRRICRDGILRATAGAFDGTMVAQLDGFAEGQEQLRFRVLGYESPSLGPRVRFGSDPMMDDYRVSVGIVYWDRSANWYTC